MSDLTHGHLLSVLAFLPLVGAAVIAFLFPRPAETDGVAGRGAGLIRWAALAVSVLAFLVSIGLFLEFDPKRAGYQFVEIAPWLPQFGASYHVGVDGISLLLILLTTFLMVISVGYSFNVKTRVKEYMIFLLVLETAMIGVFAALDLVLFYVFWEAVLIPMYFLIGIWGHERRIYAAVKFLLYTFAGSVLMLVGLIYIYSQTGSLSIVDLAAPASAAHARLAALPWRTLVMLYGAFSLAFLIKVPAFPFHTWLPDAHVEAPTAGSVILAGVLLKMGVYGFLRICIPIFPEQAHATAWVMVLLAVIGIVYGAVVAAMQPDMKKLVAYSSVSHLGFVLLGVFSFTTLGLTGAVLQSINHGVSTGMLFLIVGMLYDRRHTRQISAFGGVKRALPVLSAFFLIALVSSVALPMTNGFVGEYTILQGSLMSHTSGPVYTAIAALGMVLSAVYMLWLFQRVFAGPVAHESVSAMKDLDWRERLVLAPLVVMVFWFGAWVTTWTRVLHVPVAGLARDAGEIADLQSGRAEAASAAREAGLHGGVGGDPHGRRDTAE